MGVTPLTRRVVAVTSTVSSTTVPSCIAHSCGAQGTGRSCACGQALCVGERWQVTTLLVTLLWCNSVVVHSVLVSAQCVHGAMTPVCSVSLTRRRLSRRTSASWAGVGSHQAELVELTVLSGAPGLLELGLPETSQKVSYEPALGVDAGQSAARPALATNAAVLDRR